MTTTRIRKTLTLPVKLTPDEKLTRGADLARCYGEREIEELTKKMQAATSKTKIDTINAKAKIIVEALRTGKEDRPVECVEETDYKKKIVNTYRTDTDPWEIVATRGLTHEELQLTFKGDAPPVPPTAKEDDQVGTVTAVAGGDIEVGQVVATTPIYTPEAEALIEQGRTSESFEIVGELRPVTPDDGAPTGETLVIEEGPATSELVSGVAIAKFDDPGFGTPDPNGPSPDPGDVPLRRAPEADPLPDTPTTQPGAAGMVVDMRRTKKAKNQ